MIQLTRLNGACLAVNSDLIKYVEQAPDTVITLVNGEKLVVRESTGEVIQRVREFRRSILAEARAPWSGEEPPYGPPGCASPAAAAQPGEKRLG